MSNKLLRTGLAIALAIAAAPAAALGLGQIQVKSQPGQPLLAEIPIISSDPAELQGLQVQLASPDTFRRVGLEPPRGEVSELRFQPALDAQGRPVIRVTTAAPVAQPLLTFLVEVDWGQGRLVREYSALVETPRTVSAPLQPPVEAPTVAPSNAIVRAPPSPAPQVPAPTSVVPAPKPQAVAPAPAPSTIPPAPRPVAAVPAPAPLPAPGPEGEYTVRHGDTLAGVAADLGGSGYSLDQTMLALLRANPQAFIGGNINRLKAGAVLRRPSTEESAHYGSTEAAALVREQVAQWRGARKPQLQPAAVADADMGRAAKPAPTPRPAVSTAGTSKAADARLEITPPSPGHGQRAGTRSGTQAGGEGEMLRQELQETKETLAARNAEVQELKTRVAELEKLRQDQQQLLSMKDSELAAAQQTLAKTNTAQQAVPVVQQPAKSAPSAAAGSGSMLWLLGGMALLVAALLGWLFTRRRQEARPSRRGFDTAALAASIPPAEVAPKPAPVLEEAAPPDIEEDDPASSGEPPHWTAAPAAIGAAPTWHGSTATATPATEDVRSPAEQLDLARAYLDMGDDDAARMLLREVLDSRDPVARTTAARLLRDL